MRKGVKAACVLATSLGLLASGCGGNHKAVPSSGGGGYAQPSPSETGSAMPGTSAPESSPPSTGAPESSPPASSMTPSPVEVRAKDVRVGRILVDGKDMTLYMFEKDKGGKPTCTDACANEWPPLLTTDKVTAGSGVNASWLTTTDRPDGTKQVAYHGWPLYHYVKDTKPGDMNGQGVTSYGAPWYVVDAAKGDALKKASPGTSPMSPTPTR
jgi:predicted lipoprotein with Yx(FWY)xxD motif